MPSRDELKMLQALPLDIKIEKTRFRIREWVEEFGEDGVYVSFSGGKDSTVLLDIVRKDYPNIEAVFVNTGLEYPSVRQFALSKENVTELRPTMNFRDVIIKYGYPVIGKQFCKKLSETRRGSKIALKNFTGEMVGSIYDYSRYSFVLSAPFNVSEKCCDKMKKKPFKSIHGFPIIGSMAEESTNRLKSWCQNGCNAFGSENPKSTPISFWTEQDVLAYIHTYIHTTLPLQTHTVKWCVIGKRTDLPRGRLIFMKNLQRLSQITNFLVITTRPQVVIERVAFSADLELHKTSSVLQGLQSKNQNYVIMSCVEVSFPIVVCGNRAKTA